jgi:hypothetical protein
VPISTIGARTVSTVPSQALLMMNNEFVAQQAERWAGESIAAAPDPKRRIELMYREAFAREPDESEKEQILAFASRQQGRSEKAVWTDIAHVLFNSAEFLYVR